MAFSPFPNTLDIKTLDTGEVYTLGVIEVDEYQELALCYVYLYKHGTEGGSEQFRLRVYRNAGLTDELDTSEWVSLSQRDAKGMYDINRIRVDFNNKMLAASTNYYITMETQNYTRNADTFYLGVVLNSESFWMGPPGDSTTLVEAPVLHIFGYRELRT